MGFFLPALFVGGLGVTQHLASRELDDIVRQAEQPVFGFWWGFSLGALTGLWIGCNFGPLLLKMKNIMSSVGGWMFLSTPSPSSLHMPAAAATPSDGLGGSAAAPGFAAASSPTAAAAGYPFSHASGYMPFIHAEQQHMPQQQQQQQHHPHHLMSTPPHNVAHTESRSSDSSRNVRAAAAAAGRGSTGGHGGLAPCCTYDTSHIISRQSDDFVKQALWTQQQQQPQHPHTGRGSTTSTFVTPAQAAAAAAGQLQHAEQTAKRSSWW